MPGTKLEVSHNANCILELPNLYDGWYRLIPGTVHVFQQTVPSMHETRKLKTKYWNDLFSTVCTLQALT